MSRSTCLIPAVIGGLLLTAATAPPVAARAGTTHTRLSGNWGAPGCGYDPATGHFSCQGAELFQGTLTGTNSVRFEGIVNPRTGDVTGTGEGIFTNMSGNTGSGTLHFLQDLTIVGATHHLRCVVHITDGTGDFRGSNGEIVIDATFAGAAAGTYTGDLIRPVEE